jgi:predicted nucleic acid-binding Zn ribbon protein
MKLTREQLLKGELTRAQTLRWQLDKERFRIEEGFPQTDQPDGKKIGDILSEILQVKEADSSAVPTAVTARWPLIVGEQLEQHTSPSHLKKGVLYVHADHPGWLAELRRIPKIHMLKKLSLIPDLPEIKDIRFQLDPAIRNFKK